MKTRVAITFLASCLIAILPVLTGQSIGTSIVVIVLALVMNSLIWYIYFTSRIESPCSLAALKVSEIIQGKYEPLLREKGTKVIRTLMHNLNILSQELRAKEQRLIDLQALRIDFIANVSHELKTPLTSIQGYAETLTSGAYKDFDSSLRFINRIDENAKRLSSLVSDLLDLAKLERFPGEVEWTSFDSSEFASNLENIFFPVLSKKNQNLIVKIESARWEGDRGTLQQVLVNLIDNASRYSPDGASITITQSLVEDYNWISVSDSGSGIPKQHLDRIFERFYRVDKARSRETGGTGLGLAIVKHIVLAHGGQILAKSELNRGSEFSFSIPRKVI